MYQYAKGNPSHHFKRLIKDLRWLNELGQAGGVGFHETVSCDQAPSILKQCWVGSSYRL